jgi:hypothetical protein
VTPRPAGDPWWLETCDTMEIMRASCSHCRGLPDLPTRDDEQPALARNERVTMFEARFEGRCSECRGGIAPGDSIARAPGGHEGRYVCGECAPWAI